MKSSVEKLNDTRVKLTVEVPFEELNHEIDQAYTALAAQVNIPGFRKGKAPRKLIDARVGRGPILDQVLNDVVPSRYQKAVEEAELAVLGQPAIEITKLEDNVVIEFTAEVDVRPEIELPKFEDIAVEVPALKVDDEAIDAEIDKLRERFGELSDTKRKLKTNDFAIINVVASVDGEEIEESKAEGLSYMVGADDLIEGLDTALRGMKTGEENEFTTTLKFGEHEGKEATVKVEVVQTKERKLPELNEEFVQEASEFDTVEELREATAKRVEEQAKTAQAAAIRDAVLAAALEKTEFPLPEALVEEQAHNQFHSTFGEASHNESAIDEFLKTQGSSLEKFKAEAHEAAEKAVRTQLFLDALAEQEKPEVSQSELTDHILYTADAYGMDPKQLIQSLQQAGQIGALFADVTRGKALAAAICRVSVKDDAGNKVDADEYFGVDEEEAASE
ncbi:trigger factor [Corynebacterium felinum]|uniref:Trigger factor n=1 Tax=Corynebacterium felinum TaxID=131318 RepID=A0ABU2B4T1_9CORY|nr:trigger factor [Corynebacterium felinum]MDF5820855.1 trigger factor [Corynebacterium felinum]MDR7353619.1 trigger factor [Corynebacterium felinum]WJY95798.1 Trigger factor [Corynebacterium felinum]